MADDAVRRLDALVAAAMKLAQSAPSGRVALAQVERAIDFSWIPMPWGASIVADLGAAADAAREPIPWGEVESMLSDAWGSRPTDELDDLDSGPAAVTAGAQVHRGVLDGESVAVKVLMPGLATSIRQDLALLEGLLAPLTAAFPAVDAGAMLREVRERVLDELDLEAEAETQRRFHRALRRHPFIHVPAPVMRLSHPTVMVSEWVDGVPLLDAPDPDDAAAKLVRFSLGSHRFGMVHAALTPDDVLVLDDGRIAVLDFGASAPAAPERLDLGLRALDAFAAGDGDELGRVLDELGSLPASLGPMVLELARHALEDLAGPEPARLDVEAVAAARDRLLERPDELLEVMSAGALGPQDLWPARGIAHTFSAIAQVGATGPWLELTRSALRDGWS